MRRYRGKNEIKRVLYDYKRNCKQMRARQEELMTRPRPEGRGSRGPGDPTGRMGVILAEDQILQDLERRVQTVERLRDALGAEPEPMRTRKVYILERVYVNRSATLRGLARRLYYCERTIRRANAALLLQAAEIWHKKNPRE